MRKNSRKRVKENASPSYRATPHSFLSSQICHEAPSVDHTRIHKQKHNILVKLDTSPSWMWVNWWRGRLQSASVSKKAVLFTLTWSGGSSQSADPTCYQSLTHTLRENCSHATRRRDRAVSHIHKIRPRVITRGSGLRAGGGIYCLGTLNVPSYEKHVFSGLCIYKLVLLEPASSQNEENKWFLHGLCSPTTSKTALLQAVQNQIQTN